jgi:hypothetical protein
VLDLGDVPLATPTVERILEQTPALRRLRCGVADLRSALELPLAGLEVVQLYASRTGELPARIGGELRLLQIGFRMRDPILNFEYATAWAREHDLTLWPSDTFRTRGDDALTFARVGPGFWRWATR